MKSEQPLKPDELYDAHTSHIEEMGAVGDLYYQARHVDQDAKRADALYTYSTLLRRQYHDALDEQALLRQRARG
jgi:hypothetical protein